MKNFFTIRKILTFCLILSIFFTMYSAYYKIKYWGFSIKPQATSDVWIVDAHISFTPTGEPINVSLATPQTGKEFKILNEDIVAKGYDITKDEKNNRIIMKSKPKKSKQNIYYRVAIYDNEDTKGKIRDESKPKVNVPIFDLQQQEMVDEILLAAEKFEGNQVKKLISIFNQQPLDPNVSAFLPVRVTEKEIAEKIIDILAYKGISARLTRGVRLVESKKASRADLMIETHDGYKWRIYDLHTAKEGVPKNFMVFQRGGVSLLDVSGGRNSKIRFSVLKSVTPSIKMAGHRAKFSEFSKTFDFSIYNLPLLAQNTLKWLMVFPLGILITVLFRNVIGLKTMGTFTPMLIAMSLVKTGFIAGLICFSIIISVGLVIRTLLSRLNLLLVPRISAVVIFVILIMQYMAIIGYQINWEIAASAIFFPIIITAWIIERASIIWEEDGAGNATREILYSMITAIATYFVISNEYVRHITFAFSEINLVILFIVMLLGTYTGYRLTELKRFTPLARG